MTIQMKAYVALSVSQHFAKYSISCTHMSIMRWKFLDFITVVNCPPFLYFIFILKAKNGLSNCPIYAHEKWLSETMIRNMSSWFRNFSAVCESTYWKPFRTVFIWNVIFGSKISDIYSNICQNPADNFVSLFFHGTAEFVNNKLKFKKDIVFTTGKAILMNFTSF